MRRDEVGTSNMFCNCFSVMAHYTGWYYQFRYQISQTRCLVQIERNEIVQGYTERNKAQGYDRSITEGWEHYRINKATVKLVILLNSAIEGGMKIGNVGLPACKIT